MINLFNLCLPHIPILRDDQSSLVIIILIIFFNRFCLYGAIGFKQQLGRKDLIGICHLCTVHKIIDTQIYIKFALVSAARSKHH